MTPFVLLIGLGTHSVFEGIALGTEQDPGDSAIFALAIFLHKGTAAMSLGISLARTFPDRDWFVVGLLATFAAFTPLGVLFGMIVQGGDPMLEIVFSSLAAGTFLYIACSEVIVEEFSMPDGKCLKLCVFILGIGFISLLTRLEG